MLGRIMAIISLGAMALMFVGTITYVSVYNFVWSHSTQTVFVGDDICVMAHEVHFTPSGELNIYGDLYAYNHDLLHRSFVKSSYDKALQAVLIQYPHTMCVAIGPRGKDYTLINRSSGHSSDEVLR